MPIRTFVLAVLLCGAATLGARPAQALVINIDAVQHVAGSELGIFLEAGSYRATLVDGANDGDAATDYTAWSFAFGNAGTWVTGYAAILEDGTTLNGGAFTRVDSADEAFAMTTDRVLAIDVPTDQTVLFRVGDDRGDDNRGGVTLDLETVPEPSALALAITGAAFLGRRRSLREPGRGARTGPRARARA